MIVKYNQTDIPHFHQCLLNLSTAYLIKTENVCQLSTLLEYKYSCDIVYIMCIVRG